MDLKAAIVGCGGIFPMHADALKREGIPIAAVCDTRPERAKAQGDKYGCQPFTDYKEMLDAGGFNVLHICLPHYLHAPVAIEALKRGYHVLTEKPMATTVADAEAMMLAEKESGRTLGVIFQNRYNPGTRLVKQALESGALGKPLNGYLRVTWHRDKAYYLESGWRGFWETEGGGILINQAIHTIDLTVHLLGLPLAADSIAANRTHPYIEVEDVAEGVLRYEDGVNISFYVNTNHPNDAPIQFGLVCENGTVSVTGDEAVIQYKNGCVETAGRDADAQEVLGMKSYWGVSHILQIRDFYRTLANGGRPVIDGSEGIKSVKVLQMIYDSSREKGMLHNGSIK
jgi:predicted dehydrogenase